MRKTLIAIAALAAIAVTVAAVASAGSAPAKQRVAILLKGNALFVLKPLTAGAVKPDAGAADFCCWTQRSIIQDGEAIDINNPQMTLIGKHGTIVARNEISWIDVPDGYSLFTGTWKVVRGTGAYAGLTGGGRGGGVELPNSTTRVQYEGWLSPK